MIAFRSWAGVLVSQRAVLDPRRLRLASLILAVAPSLIMLLPPNVSQAVILNAMNDVWIRERQPTATFEGDLLSVWNSRNTSDTGKRRYGVVEFDLSSLTGVQINLATIGLWNFGHGFSDQNKAIKQSAVYINTAGGGTPAASMTWNAYQNEYAAGALALSGLGAFNLPAQVAPNAYSYSAGATAADLVIITSAANSGNRRLTLVLIADETTSGELAHSWGDGETLGSMSPQLLINEEQVNLTLRINTTTGVMAIVNPGIDPTINSTFAIDGYVINSPAGALDVGGFAGLSAGGQQGWQIVTPTSTNLSELNLSESTEFAEGGSRLLGTSYTTGAAPDAGLSFTYNIAGGGTAIGQVEYVTGGVAGDYNGNGVVDSSDYVVWRNGGSPDSSQAGYLLWRSRFGQQSGAGSLATNASAPESSTATMAAIALCLSAACSHRRH